MKALIVGVVCGLVAAGAVALAGNSDESYDFYRNNHPSACDVNPDCNGWNRYVMPRAYARWNGTTDAATGRPAPQQAYYEPHHQQTPVERITQYSYQQYAPAPRVVYAQVRAPKPAKPVRVVAQTRQPLDLVPHNLEVAVAASEGR